MGTLSKYMKIRHYVSDLLIRHKNPEEPIMSEREMCEVFHVTRNTVRKAVAFLIKAGELIPRQGKGVFINPAIQKNTDRNRVIHKIMLIWGDGRQTFADYWLLNAIARISDAVRQRNAVLQFCNLVGEEGNESDELEMYMPHAVIWIRPINEMNDCIEKIRGKVPVCLIFGTDDFGGFSVTIDYFQAGRKAAEWFLERNLIRTVYAGYGKAPLFKEFLNGWKDAYSARGMVYDEKRLLLSAEDDIAELLAHGIPGGFDAVFCHANISHAVKSGLAAIGREDSLLMTDSKFFPYEDSCSVPYSLDFYPDFLFSKAVEQICSALESPEKCGKSFLYVPEIVSNQTKKELK